MCPSGETLMVVHLGLASAKTRPHCIFSYLIVRNIFGLDPTTGLILIFTHTHEQRHFPPLSTDSYQEEKINPKMADNEEEPISVYDEVEIEDMTYDETLQIYHYPCPCGDRFEISIMDLRDESNDIAVCPSCSLMIRVIFEVVSF